MSGMWIRAAFGKARDTTVRDESGVPPWLRSGTAAVAATESPYAVVPDGLALVDQLEAPSRHQSL